MVIGIPTTMVAGTWKVNLSMIWVLKQLATQISTVNILRSWSPFFNLCNLKRLLQVDGKVRTEPKFPAGFMDVIQIEKTAENFRLIYDVKGR